MKEQFCDFETSKMLKELGYTQENELAWYGRRFPDMQWKNFYMGENVGEGDFQCTATLWQQVEAWLWEKHKIFMIITEECDRFECFINSGKLKYNIGQIKRIFASPITAKTEGIKAAVKHLHSQLQPKK